MLKEKTYKVQEIFEWYKKFENIDVKIKSETKEFEIEIRDKYLPHLLGLQYINPANENIRGKRLYSYVKEENLSDQDILKRIEKNYGIAKRENILKRIETFQSFFNNLENGIVVEKTLKTNMNVNYLIIQNKENDFYHLGILSGSNGALLVDFEKIENKREKDILRSYFVEGNKEYFKDTKIIEPIENIEKYDEKEKRYIPFSFDEEKNRKLLNEYFNKNIKEKTQSLIPKKIKTKEENER